MCQRDFQTRLITSLSPWILRCISIVLASLDSIKGSSPAGRVRTLHYGCSRLKPTESLAVAAAPWQVGCTCTSL